MSPAVATVADEEEEEERERGKENLSLGENEYAVTDRERTSASRTVISEERERPFMPCPADETLFATVPAFLRFPILMNYL